jgi:undecaprenyl diphosphate synthase
MSYPYVWKQEQHMPHSKKIDYEKLPAHIAIVMDGNGRWAQQRSLPRLAGHNAGMKTLKNIVKASSQVFDRLRFLNRKLEKAGRRSERYF